MKKHLIQLLVLLCSGFPGVYLWADVQQSILFQIEAGSEPGQVYYQSMEGRPYGPRGVCSDGNYFYIGDIHNNRILVVDAEGAFLREIINEDIGEFEAIYCYADSLWIKIFDHYYETASLLKYTPQGDLVYKTNSSMIQYFREDIVDYYFSDEGIYAIHEDDTVEQINLDNGKAQKVVPSFWVDHDGYYALTREENSWHLAIYDPQNGKLQKKIQLSLQDNETPQLKKVNARVYVEQLDDQQNAVLFHYDQQGELDEKINKDIAMAKYFDLKYSIRYSQPETDYIEIIQYQVSPGSP